MARDLNQVLRPASWNAVIGQSDIKDIIIAAIENETFPNFSIFCGPTGVGKSCMAELTAKTLICTGEDKPCGKCPSCLSAERSIVKYNMASMLGKKDIVQVLDGIFKYEGVFGKTIYILEEVQVLKQKEEQTPFLEELTKIPPDVYVMMCTTRVNSLLPAMRNRATVFQLTIPSTEECVDLIRSTLETLHLQPMSLDSMTTLATLSENTPRNIIKHIGLLASNGGISDGVISKFFKTVSKQEYINCLNQLISPDISVQDFVRYLKSLESVVTYTSLVHGLRDFILTALIEVSMNLPDPTMSVEDRKHMQNVMSLISKKDFLHLVGQIGELKGDVIADDKSAMFELITLKLKVLDINPVTAIKMNNQAAGVARAESIKHSQAFVRTPATTEEVTTHLTGDILETLTGISGGVGFTE
ncbi:MAG: AAA family ATPase [Clostridia bacterium]